MEEPANQKLWAMVVFQAKQKYRIYPSPGASHWVHKRYLELGGRFIDTEKEEYRRELARKMLEYRRKDHHAHGHHDPKDMNKPHSKVHGKDKEDK